MHPRFRGRMRPRGFRTRAAQTPSPCVPPAAVAPQLPGKRQVELRHSPADRAVLQDGAAAGSLAGLSAPGPTAVSRCLGLPDGVLRQCASMTVEPRDSRVPAGCVGACVTEGTSLRQTCNPLISETFLRLTPASPGWAARPAHEPGSLRTRAFRAGNSGFFLFPSLGGLATSPPGSRGRAPASTLDPHPQLLLHVEARKGPLKEKASEKPCCSYPFHGSLVP